MEKRVVVKALLDNFEINTKFQDKMARIRIPLPPVEQEKKKVAEVVHADRKYQIDAAIVRIMKARKVLKHSELMTETVTQLSSSFKPDVKTIKKRITDLQEREFLERDKNDPQLFRYLA